MLKCYKCIIYKFFPNKKFTLPKMGQRHYKKLTLSGGLGVPPRKETRVLHSNMAPQGDGVGSEESAGSLPLPPGRAQSSREKGFLTQSSQEVRPDPSGPAPPRSPLIRTAQGREKSPKLPFRHLYAGNPSQKLLFPTP